MDNSSSNIEYELLLASNSSGSPWGEDGDNGSSTFYEWEDWGDYYYPSGYTRTGLILTSLFVTAIMVLIVVGNMLVCIAIATEKSLKTVQNWFIASLAVSDFLVGLVVMPFSLAKEVMGYWIFGRFWCEMHSALDVFLCTASINSLCLISLDRYWSVTHAVEYLRKRTPRRSIAMIAGVWLLSAVISLPPLVGWKKPESNSSHSHYYPECLLSDDVGYVLYSAFGSFYVPAFVMVFVYCRIFVAARSRARRHLEQRRRAAQELTTTTATKSNTTTTTTTTTTSFCAAADKSNGDATATQIAAPQIIIDDEDDDDDEDEDKEEEEEEDRGGSRLYVSSQEEEAREQQRRPSLLLRAPRFLKSPFGSTLSLADLGRSSEDVTTDKSKASPRQEEAPPRPVASQATEAERHRRRIARARERRATLILGLIMASFILAWLPFFVLYVLEALCRSACDIGATGFAIAFWLGYCNSALNPIIYTIFNRDFRRAFRKILFK